MLISFSVTNWMSFRDRVTLSMVASRERQHGRRVARLGRYQMRVLPIMALYGGNASGKTNLVKALSFAKTRIVEGSAPGGRIPVIPFLLDNDCAQQPSRFEFEILIAGCVYALSFSVTGEKVIEERLVRVGSTSERTLYARRHGDYIFDRTLRENLFLEYLRRGTRDNQLFLTNSVSQNVENFKDIYNWFNDNLQIITPETRYGLPSFYENSSVADKMNEMLLNFDTGISRMDSERLPAEYLKLPAPVNKRLQDEISEGKSVHLAGPSNQYLKMTRENGDLVASKCVTVHRMTDGTETHFEVAQESDGSQRFIDLLPAFIDLSSGHSERVYVIDEMDRSLHTLLTRRLLEHYLAACTPRIRAQLLFTTHDVLLMDQRWLRRDEMWVTERDTSGASSLLSFSEYRDVRYDKDIRKSYLQGRLGGIPRINPTESVHVGAE